MPSAKPIATGELPRYSLSFDKRSYWDGSGKCNVRFTGQAQDRVHGVIYEISPAHRGLLDDAEGLGHGYDHTIELVETGNTQLPAFLYMAQAEFIEEDLKPYSWYKRLVELGARAHGLPKGYVQRIAAVDAAPDHDAFRAEHHFAYCDGAWDFSPA